MHRVRLSLPNRLTALKTLCTTLALASLGLSPLAHAQPTAKITKTKTVAKTNNRTDLAATIDQRRHEYTLDNGLKVIIQEDHRAPVVMSQIWYRVGATDEPEHLGGISHLLEHMMFKGTPKVSSADFERVLAKFGGSNNAFTTHDYTAYYEVLPANRLGLALELEADRMTNLTLRQSDFDSERQVVMEERRLRTDDNPNARAFEQFSRMAYPDSPKGESVIGPMAEIAGIKLSDLAAWYRQWYAPNNATVVIVGDVKPEEALAQVKRYFGDKQPQTLPTRPSVRQAGFRGYHEAHTALPVQVPSLIMAYNLPTLTTADDPNEAYQLALLSQVLDGGLSARLEKNLVREQQVLAAVGSGYSAFDRGDGLLLIHATPRDGVSLAQAQAALLAQIEQLKTAPISAQELSRAKTNTLTELVYAQDSLAGQARTIGSLASIGIDDREIYHLPERFARITPADLQRTAQRYLTKDNLTVLYVEPSGQTHAKNSADSTAMNTAAQPTP
ncbi:M16 family metallopeptidase [Faucicola atlantae]|uniref:M16 family metallopeptidase n=1 Tax=Faucicola atlantae TaxID=34059 RepID=UPI0009F4BE2C|nr:pitrilysin family protein [Moraxella atlantae]